jgi:peptide methionine sulfoxide reductase MsrB
MWKKLSTSDYYVCYNERTESEEHKAALYQEAEGLLNDVIESEEHFGLTALRWAML